MKNQRGAALVVVMSLLSAGLTIGVMNMQTSQIDERLAGNYRASVQAQMNAESALSDALAGGVFNSIDWSEVENPGDDLGDWISSLPSNAYEELKEDESYDKTDVCGSNDENRCFYFPLLIGSDRYVVALGAVSDGQRVVAESSPIFAFRDGGSGGGNGEVTEIDFDLPDEFFMESIIAGSHIIVNSGQSNIDENMKSKNYGFDSHEKSVPDPRDDYIGKVEEFFTSSGASFDDNGCSRNSGFVFCSHDKGFHTEENERFDIAEYYEEGAVFVFDIPEGGRMFVNGVSNDFGNVKASFVSSGALTMSGTNHTNIEGFIWSAGPFVSNGGGNSFSINGGLVSGDSVEFNGGVNMSFDSGFIGSLLGDLVDDAPINFIF